MSTTRLLPRLYTWLIPVLMVAVMLAGVLAVRANVKASDAACKAVNQTKVVVAAVLKKTVDLSDPKDSPAGTPAAVIELRKRQHEVYLAFYKDVKRHELAATDCSA